MSNSTYELYCGKFFDNKDVAWAKAVDWLAFIFLCLAFLAKLVEWTCLECECFGFRGHKEVEKRNATRLNGKRDARVKWINAKESEINSVDFDLNNDPHALSNALHSKPGNMSDDEWRLIKARNSEGALVPPNDADDLDAEQPCGGHCGNRRVASYHKLVFNFLNYFFQKTFSGLIHVAVLIGWAELGQETGEWYWFTALLIITAFHGILNFVVLTQSHDWAFAGLKFKRYERGFGLIFEIFTGFFLMNRICRAWATMRDSRYLAKKVSVYRVEYKERNSNDILHQEHFTYVPKVSIDQDGPEWEKMTAKEQRCSERALEEYETYIRNNRRNDIMANLKEEYLQRNVFSDADARNYIRSRPEVQNIHVNEANDAPVNEANALIPGAIPLQNLQPPILVELHDGTRIPTPSDDLFNPRLIDRVKRTGDDHAWAQYVANNGHAIDFNDNVTREAQEGFSRDVIIGYEIPRELTAEGILSDGDLKQDNYIIRLVYSVGYAGPAAILYLMFILRYGFETLECNELKLWKYDFSPNEEFIPSTYIALADAAMHVAMSAVKVNVKASNCTKFTEYTLGVFEVGTKIVAIGVLFWSSMLSTNPGLWAPIAVSVVSLDFLLFFLFFFFRQIDAERQLKWYFEKNPEKQNNRDTILRKGILELLWYAYVGFWVNLVVPGPEGKAILDTDRDRIENHEIALMRGYLYWPYRFVFTAVYVLLFLFGTAGDVQPRLPPTYTGDWWDQSFYTAAFSAFLAIFFSALVSLTLKFFCGAFIWKRSAVWRDSRWCYYKIYKNSPHGCCRDSLNCCQSLVCCFCKDHSACKPYSGDRFDGKFQYTNVLATRTPEGFHNDSTGKGCCYDCISVLPCYVCCFAKGHNEQTKITGAHEDSFKVQLQTKPCYSNCFCNNFWVRPSKFCGSFWGEPIAYKLIVFLGALAFVAFVSFISRDIFPTITP